MLAYVPDVNNFPRERLVVRREMRRNVGGYHPGAYFLQNCWLKRRSICFSQLRFGSIAFTDGRFESSREKEFVSTLALHAASSAALGLAVSAIAPTSETALAIGPRMMVLSIMLGDATGAFVKCIALKPLSNLSVVKWSFEGVLASEFENLTFDKNDVETNSSKQLRLRAEKKNREKSHSIVYDATKWAEFAQVRVHRLTRARRRCSRRVRIESEGPSERCRERTDFRVFTKRRSRVYVDI